MTDLPLQAMDLIELDGATHAPRGSAARSTPDPDAATVRLFGWTFQAGDARSVLAAAAARPADRPRMVVTANVDHVVQLADNPAFRAAYDRAAVRTLDGMPLVWLARACRGRPAARITGHDLMDCVLADPAAFAGRVFIVCAAQEVAETLRARFVAAGMPGEAVAYAVPPFGFEADPDYGRALARRIRAHGTGLLLMGVGAPKSETWVDRQGTALGAPVVLAVGEALAVAAGCVPRAPRLMQRLGLEWLFRFARAPRRLFRRYFVTSWRFVAIAARERRYPD